MSVGAVSGPDPAFYSYPSTLPPSTAVAASSTSGTSSTASSAAAAPLSSYQAEFATLQQDDAAELMQVSLGSTANAQSNVASVLAQAATLQAQRQAALQAQAAASADGSSKASASGPLTLPTLQSVFDQSDSDASTNLSNYQSSGSSIDLLA